MTSPLLWYLNRGTGVVLLVVFTATVVLGVLATGRSATPLWPRFVTQGLHRALAALVGAHAGRPRRQRGRRRVRRHPLVAGVRAVRRDLRAGVDGPRRHLARPHRARRRHLGGPRPGAAPGVVRRAPDARTPRGRPRVVHGLFIGTDSGEGWMVTTYVACVAAVGLAVLARLVAVARGTWVRRRTRPARRRRAPSGRRAVGPARGTDPRRRAHRRRCVVIHPPASVDVHSGPLLLSGIDRGPGLAAHRARLGAAARAGRRGPRGPARARSAVRGRGGAGFPLARKLQTVVGAGGSHPGLTSRRPFVVVNAAEGEPASAKDSALLDVAPHLVLDGAVIAARALGAREVHVVTSAGPALGRGGGRPRPPRNATTTASDGCSTRPRRGSSPGSPVPLHRADGRAAGPAGDVLGPRGRRRPPPPADAAVERRVVRPPRRGGAVGRRRGTPPTAHPTSRAPRCSPSPRRRAADGAFTGVHVVEVEHGARRRDRARRRRAVRAPARRRVPRLVGAPARRARPELVERLARRGRGAAGRRAAAVAGRRLVPGVARPRATPTTWPGSRPGGADPAATGCPPWPTRCAGSPRAPTPGGGCASWPGWSPVAARAPTPTAPPAWWARC